MRIVATWPDYPKKTESPLSLEEAGTLVGDLVMKEGCRAYKMDFTDELAEFKITDQGESGGGIVPDGPEYHFGQKCGRRYSVLRMRPKGARCSLS